MSNKRIKKKKLKQYQTFKQALITMTELALKEVNDKYQNPNAHIGEILFLGPYKEFLETYLKKISVLP